MRALIVDQPQDRASVSAARALAADGWTVGTAAWRRSLAAHSRCVTAHHVVPHPNGETDPFVAAVAGVVEDHGYDVVLPGWDRALLALSEHRERIRAVIPYAPHDTVVRTLDKLTLTEAAHRAGLAAPRTAEATAEAVAAWEGPLIIKPRLHVPVYAAAAAFASTGPAAVAHAEGILRRGGQPLVQEHLPGHLDALVVVVARDGALLTASQQRAELTWPPGAGVTARGVSVPVDPELLERTAALLRELGWFGLAQLQLITPADGVPRVLEVNGRIYGSLALSLRAGVNHPAAWARAAVGLPVAGPTLCGAPGARFQWLSRDVRASLQAADRGRQLARAARFAVTAAHTVYSPADPGVAGAFLAEQGRRAGARLRRRDA